jgi:hypothetical protein
MTIYETNISNTGLLCLFRLACFGVISWLVYVDVKLKNGLAYEKYTVWGEISTLATFFFLLVCSFEKYIKEIQYKEGNRSTRKNMSILDGGVFYKITAILFEWSLLCELTLTLLFWTYLYGIATDTSSMSRADLLAKINYDLLEDVSNYNHSIPVALLLMEYMVNNI